MVSRNARGHILPLLPIIDEKAGLVYFNPDTPAPPDKLVFEISFVLPFYKAAFESLTVLATTGCGTVTPLNYNFDFYFLHHRRFDQLSEVLSKNVPKVLFLAPDNVAGAAAVRLIYDGHYHGENRHGSAAPQRRTVAFLKRLLLSCRSN